MALWSLFPDEVVVLMIALHSWRAGTERWDNLPRKLGLPWLTRCTARSIDKRTSG